jgi:hypothetical protein
MCLVTILEGPWLKRPGGYSKISIVRPRDVIESSQGLYSSRAMGIHQQRTVFPSMWSLLLIAVLAACGSDSSNGQTVAVNLSLIVDSRQAQHRPVSSRLFAWIERWLPGATPAWAQHAVTDVASIQVQITGPGIAAPVIQRQFRFLIQQGVKRSL